MTAEGGFFLLISFFVRAHLPPKPRPPRTWAAGLTRRRCAALSLALGFLLALGVTAAAGQAAFARTCAAVRADTLRLHIVAASDTVLDQTLKLRVRDAVVAQAAALCAGCETPAQARAAFLQGLPALTARVRQLLADAGRPQPVTVCLETAWFATGHYGACTLPPGQYEALRITLGGGAGHNWWCCLYPALCLSASGAGYDTPAENALVTGGYEIRFAALEWWQRRRNGGA